MLEVFVHCGKTWPDHFDVQTENDILFDDAGAIKIWRKDGGFVIYPRGAWTKVDARTPPPLDRDALVERALASPTTMDFVRLNKKVLAIKELRTITGCGLAEAKDAIEDYRVWPE